MSTKYTIHVVNKKPGATKKFFCFLSAPEKINGQEVFANSSKFVTLTGTKSGKAAKFDIGLQYSLTAGSANTPVDVGLAASGNISENVDLDQIWDADFYVNDDQQTPDLTLAEKSGAGNDIVQVRTNAFNDTEEADYDWFQYLTYGVNDGRTQMGYTWSPEGNTEYDLTPQVEFYINTGSFTPGELVNLHSSGRDAAVVSNDDFDSRNVATVTYNSDGTWDIEPGAPSRSALSPMASALSELSAAQNTLASLLERSVDSDPRLLLPMDISSIDAVESQVILDQSSEDNELLLTVGLTLAATATMANVLSIVTAAVVEKCSRNWEVETWSFGSGIIKFQFKKRTQARGDSEMFSSVQSALAGKSKPTPCKGKLPPKEAVEIAMNTAKKQKEITKWNFK